DLSDVGDDLGRRIAANERVRGQVVDGYGRLTAARPRLVEQDAGEAHLEVLEDGGEILELVDTASAGGAPEALEGAVDAEAGVLGDQAAHDLAGAVGDEQAAVEGDV